MQVPDAWVSTGVVAAVACMAVAAVLLNIGASPRAHRSRIALLSTGVGTSNRIARATPFLARTFPTFYRKLGGADGPEALLSASNHLIGTPSSTVGATSMVLLRTVEDLLRTGMPTAQAWQKAGIMTTGAGVPLREGVKQALLGPQQRAHKKELATADRIARMIEVSCLVAHDLGIALNPVLMSIADVVASDLAAQEERRIALAGPKMSAVLLQVLPAVGVLGGVFLGVGPLEWFLGSALGIANLGVGLGLLAVGRSWTSRLINTAAKG